MSNRFVGIAEIAFSNDPEETLTAPNLGSCVGVAVYDAVAQRGAVIHCLLPLSSSDPEKAKSNPCMYVDTGVVLLLEKLLTQGCDKKRLRIVAVGGGNMNDENNVFEIGKRNYTVLKKVLWKNNLLLKGEDFGGPHGRTLGLEIGTGKTWLKIQGKTQEI